MSGEYVRYYGKLAKIIHEHYGVATIKIIQNNSYQDVFLFLLQPVNLRIS